MKPMIALLFLVVAGTVQADEIVNVQAVADYGYTGSIAESIDVSYFYDVTLSEIVPGTETISSEGVLGQFAIAPNGGFYDPQGDFFAIQIYEPFLDDYQPTFPATGTYNSKWDLFLNCVSEACWTPGLGPGNDWGDPGSSLTVSSAASIPVSTPEPGTLTSLAMGMFGVFLLRFARRWKPLKPIIGLGMLLIASVGAARADEIVNVSVTADFSGVELIATAFQYDATTLQVSDLSFSSSGPLGPFTYVSGSLFDWQDAAGDTFQIFPDSRPDTGDPIFPSPGTYAEFDVDLWCTGTGLICEEALRSGMDYGNTNGSTAEFTVTAADAGPPVSTPEPNPLYLSGLGFLMLLIYRPNEKNQS